MRVMAVVLAFGMQLSIQSDKLQNWENQVRSFGPAPELSIHRAQQLGLALT
jgi:hypothetical protein